MDKIKVTIHQATKMDYSPAAIAKLTSNGKWQNDISSEMQSYEDKNNLTKTLLEMGVLTWRSTRSLPGSGWSSSRRAATASSALRLVERVRASASSSHTISSGRDTLMLDMPRSWPLGYLASHRTSGVVAGCVYGCID